MDQFDLFTILIMYAAMTFLFSMFLISTAVTLKNKFKGIIHILLGFLFFSIGMTALTIRDYLPFQLFTSILFGNYTLMAGVFILNLGIRKLFGIKSNAIIYRAVYLMYVILFLYFSVVDINISMRIILSSLIISSVFIRTAAYLLSTFNRSQETYLRNLSYMLLVYALTHFLRIVAAIMNFDGITNFMTYTQDIIFQLAGILALFLIFIYIIIIINKLLAHELEEKLKENESLISSLEQLTNVDYLTGLYNRKSLEEKVYKLIEKCQSEHTTFQYVFIDINTFKEINDRFGHPFGDQILINFGQLLIQYTEFVYRFGGDEFVIIFEDSSIVAEDVIKEIILKCSNDVTKTDSLPYFSYGIHVWKDGQCYADMMKEADQMMYHHKRDTASS